MNPPRSCLNYFANPVIITENLISGHISSSINPQYGLIVRSSQIPGDYLEQFLKLVKEGELFNITEICKINSSEQQCKYVLTVVPKQLPSLQVNEPLSLQAIINMNLFNCDLNMYTSILYQLLNKTNELHINKIVHAALTPSNVYYNIEQNKLLLGPPLSFVKPLLTNFSSAELNASTPEEIATQAVQSVSWKTDCYQIGYTLLCLILNCIITDKADIPRRLEEARECIWCGSLNYLIIQQLLGDYEQRPRVGSILECLTDGVVLQKEPLEAEKIAAFDKATPTVTRDHVTDHNVEPPLRGNNIRGSRRHGRGQGSAHLSVLDKYEEFSISRPSTASSSHSTEIVELHNSSHNYDGTAECKYEVIPPPGAVMTPYTKKEYARRSKETLQQNKHEFKKLIKKYESLARMIQREERREPELMCNVMQESVEDKYNPIQNLLERKSNFVLKIHRFCFKGHSHDKNMNISCQFMNVQGQFYGEVKGVLFRQLAYEGVSQYVDNCYIELFKDKGKNKLQSDPLTLKMTVGAVKIFEGSGQNVKEFEIKFVNNQSQDIQWCSTIDGQDRIQYSLAVLQ